MDINEIMNLISSQAFQQIINVSNFKIAQFDALTAILIKNQIPFDVAFKSVTRREDSSLSVTIYINPTTTLTYNFSGLAENN